MERRDLLLEPVVLEHTEQSGLPGIVEAEKKELGVLVVQAEVGQRVPKVVQEEHGEKRSVCLGSKER